jgi:hypothetical protein
MPKNNFNDLDTLGMHIVQQVEEVGKGTQASMRAVACVAHQDLKAVLHHMATVLQTNLNLIPYRKENICSTSKSSTITVKFGSRWVYFSLYETKGRIRVIMKKRREQMLGRHVIYTTEETDCKIDW